LTALKGTFVLTQDLQLDELDRAIVVFVHRYRRGHRRGPTWGEVRAGVGLPRLDLSTDALLAWWDTQLPDSYPTTRAARRAFKWAVKGADPLPRRLHRLKWAGYLKYTQQERSLDVGRRVRAWEADRRRSA